MSYFTEAINQGIGPVLWNVMGVIGILVGALSFMMPRVKYFSKMSQQILINTYAVGSFSFGLLAGRAVTEHSHSKELLNTWATYLYTPVLVFLLLGVFSLNLVVWYFSDIVNENSAARAYLLRKPALIKLVVCSCLLYTSPSPRDS